MRSHWWCLHGFSQVGGDGFAGGVRRRKGDISRSGGGRSSDNINIFVFMLNIWYSDTRLYI